MARAIQVAAPYGWAVVDARGVPLPRVSAFLQYLHAVERSPNTIRAYASDLAHLHSFLELEGTAWTAIDNEVLSRFVRHLRAPSAELSSVSNPDGRRAPSTVNRCMAAVAAFALYLADATGDDVYAQLMKTARRSISRHGESPRTVVTVGPRLVQPREPHYILTDMEVGAILGACTRLRDRFLFTLLNETGMRIGQALLLRHSDIRVAESCVLVQRRAEDRDDTVKNKSRRFAVVPVSAHLIRLYATYQHREYGVLDSDFVFVNLWSGIIGRPLTYATVDRLVQRLRTATGLTRWSAHSFRHTFITRLLDAGVSIETVSYLATHASVLTTLDTYSHASVERVRQELRKAGIWDESI